MVEKPKTYLKWITSSEAPNRRTFNDYHRMVGTLQAIGSGSALHLTDNAEG